LAEFLENTTRRGAGESAINDLSPAFILVVAAIAIAVRASSSPDFSEHFRVP